MADSSSLGSFGPMVSGMEVLPQDGTAHAQPDAHRGQAVAGARLAGEMAGQLDHQPDARTGERMAERDRADVLLYPVSLVARRKFIGLIRPCPAFTRAGSGNPADI